MRAPRPTRLRWSAPSPCTPTGRQAVQRGEIDGRAELVLAVPGAGAGTQRLLVAADAHPVVERGRLLRVAAVRADDPQRPARGAGSVGHGAQVGDDQAADRVAGVQPGVRGARQVGGRIARRQAIDRVEQRGGVVRGGGACRRQVGVGAGRRRRGATESTRRPSVDLHPAPGKRSVDDPAVADRIQRPRIDRCARCEPGSCRSVRSRGRSSDQR